MKQEQNQFEETDHSPIQLESTTLTKNIFDKCNILYPNNFEGYQYCTDCTKYPVICNKEECICSKTHNKCQYFQKINNFHHNINSKLHPKHDISQIRQITDQIIDEISDLSNNIQNQYKYFGLNSAQQKITRVIQNLNIGQQSIGEQFKKYRLNRQVKEDQFEASTQKYCSLIRNSKLKILNFFAKLQLKIYQEHKKYSPNFQISQINSDILKSSQQAQKLHKFLSQKQAIIRLKKLYSHNKLNTQKMQSLLETCENKQNLLFLVQNSYGKKFGAYTKCKFENINALWKVDESGQSFMFSIDMDIKLKLDNKKCTFKINNSGEKQNIFFGIQKYDQRKNDNCSQIGMKISMNQSTYIDIPTFDFKDLNGLIKQKQLNLKNLQIYEVFYKKQQKQELNKVKQQENKKIRSQKQEKQKQLNQKIMIKQFSKSNNMNKSNIQSSEAQLMRQMKYRPIVHKLQYIQNQINKSRNKHKCEQNIKLDQLKNRIYSCRNQQTYKLQKLPEQNVYNKKGDNQF